MSRCEQETARKKLRAVVASSGKHLWEEERRSVPAKLFYRINLDALEELLSALLPGGDCDSGDAAIKNVGLPHTEENTANDAETDQTSMLESNNQECSDPTTKNGGLARSTTETTKKITSETSERKGELINYSPKKPKARRNKQKLISPRSGSSTLSYQPLLANIDRTVNLTASHIASEDLPSAPASDPPIAGDEFNKCVDLLIRPDVGLPIQGARKLANLSKSRFDKLFLHVLGWVKDKDSCSPFGGHGGLFNRVNKDFNEKTIDELDWKQKESELFLAYYPRTYVQFADGPPDNSTLAYTDIVIATETLPARVDINIPALTFAEKEAEITRRLDVKEWQTGSQVIFAPKRSPVFNALRQGVPFDALCKLIDDATDFVQVIAGIDKLQMAT